MHWGDRPRWVCRPAGRRHACGSVLSLHGSPTCPNAWAGIMFPSPSSPVLAVIMTDLSKNRSNMQTCLTVVFFLWFRLCLELPFQRRCVSHVSHFQRKHKSASKLWLTLFLNRHCAVQLENIDCTEQRESYITSQRTFYLYFFFQSLTQFSFATISAFMYF